MDRYKKKSLGFANVEEKRDLRFMRKSVDRANLKHKRLSELRQIDLANLTLDEQDEKPVDKEKTALKHEPKKVTYAEKLKKWKEEKELRKKLEAKKKIPVFKVHHVRYEPLTPPVGSISKKKETCNFIPKPSQISKVIPKSVSTLKDCKPVATRAIQKPLPSGNAVPKSASARKENSRFIPAGKTTPRPVPPCNPTQKPFMITKHTAVKSPNPESFGTVAVSSGLKPPSVSCSAQKGIKPPFSNNSVPKASRTQLQTSAALNTRIPKSGIACRILPPRSCNKQITASKDSVANVSAKNLQQKKIPVSQIKEKNSAGNTNPTRPGMDSNTKYTEDTASESKEQIAATCKEESTVKKLKTRRPSFAPDDFVFEAPKGISNFEYPSGGTGITAMFAKVFGITLPRINPIKESCKQTESEEQSSHPSKDAEVARSESVMNELNVNNSSLDGASSEPESQEKAQEFPVTESCSQAQPASKEKVKAKQEEPSIPLPVAVGSEKASTEQDVPKGRTRKSKLISRQLQSISEISELLNDSELESGLLGFDTENMSFSKEKTPTPRRSRRHASIFGKPSPLLESKCFKQSNSETDSAGTSVGSSIADDDAFPLIETTPVSNLVSGLVELSVDSPVTKQRRSRVHKIQPQNRISLLGTPEGPQTRSRKSVKGDLISFSPIV